MNVVPPRQPFAANDSATVAEDSNNNPINVLANDIPTTGGTLTITQLNGTNVTPGQQVATTHGTVIDQRHERQLYARGRLFR